MAAATARTPLDATPDGRRLAGVASCARPGAPRGPGTGREGARRGRDQRPAAAGGPRGPSHATPAAAVAGARLENLPPGAASPDELVTRLAQTSPAEWWTESATARFQPSHRARLAIVAASADMLAQKQAIAAKQLLQAAAAPVLQQQGIFYRRPAAVRPRIAFLFAGQGSQYPGMLRQLVDEVPAAAAAMRRLDAVMLRQGCPTFAQIAWQESGQLGTTSSSRRRPCCWPTPSCWPPWPAAAFDPT